MTFRILLALACALICARQAPAQGAQASRVGVAFDGMVEVGGGRRLHFKCAGEGRGGSPTVLLESGAGQGAAAWERVQAEASKLARVCAYDRAGLGKSDPVDAPRTIVGLTEDLRALLSKAGVPGPYVLVGHSLGGILARMY